MYLCHFPPEEGLEMSFAAKTGIPYSSYVRCLHPYGQLKKKVITCIAPFEEVELPVKVKRKADVYCNSHFHY